jgi:hypothetical protein
MLHIHVDATNFQFAQHLVKPLFFCLRPFGLVDPPDVVVLLVGWSRLIIIHQTALFQRFLDKIGHGMIGALQVVKITVH